MCLILRKELLNSHTINDQLVNLFKEKYGINILLYNENTFLYGNKNGKYTLINNSDVYYLYKNKTGKLTFITYEGKDVVWDINTKGHIIVKLDGYKEPIENISIDENGEIRYIDIEEYSDDSDEDKCSNDNEKLDFKTLKKHSSVLYKNKKITKKRIFFVDEHQYSERISFMKVKDPVNDKYKDIYLMFIDGKHDTSLESYSICRENNIIYIYNLFNCPIDFDDKGNLVIYNINGKRFLSYDREYNQIGINRNRYFSKLINMETGEIEIEEGTEKEQEIYKICLFIKGKYIEIDKNIKEIVSVNKDGTIDILYGIDKKYMGNVILSDEGKIINNDLTN